MNMSDIGSSICNMKYSEMIEAADHLNKAFHLLMDVYDKVMGGVDRFC